MQPSSRDTVAGGGGEGTQDDFFDQMLSTLPSAWADLGGGGGGAAGKSPWEVDPAAAAAASQVFDESALLASRLRHHQIGGAGGGGGEKPVMLQLSELHRQAGGGEEDGSGAFSPLPLFTDRTNVPPREEMEGGFKSPNAAAVRAPTFLETLVSFLTTIFSSFSDEISLSCAGRRARAVQRVRRARRQRRRRAAAVRPGKQADRSRTCHCN
jgi:hypothetical protein